MELNILKFMMTDKTFINPANNEEVFKCSDLKDDYEVCRKERQYSAKNESIGVTPCYEYRNLA